MTTPTDIGSFYFALKEFVGDKTAFTYIFADRIEITPNGDLIAWGHFQDDKLKPQLLMSLAKGQWLSIHSASMLDDRALCVDHSIF